MEITVKRRTKTPESTISDLSIDGKRECYTIEDFDRDITSDTPLVEIQAKKVFGKTAIPSGRYEVINSFSNHFQKYLPLLLSVPGFAGVRIHNGNTAENSEGCLIVGQTETKDFVGNSRAALASLLAKMKAVEKKEKIFITIQNGTAKAL